jgi:ribonuclease HI
MSLFGEVPKAPSRPFKASGEVEIYFDGGCLGNPGQKYGSFQVKLDGKEIVKRSRVDFGFGTNNEAEFNALKLALDEAVRC